MKHSSIAVADPVFFYFNWQEKSRKVKIWGAATFLTPPLNPPLHCHSKSDKNNSFQKGKKEKSITVTKDN